MLASSGIQMDYEPMNLTVVANTPGEKRKAEEEESGESPEGEPKRAKTSESDYVFDYPSHAGPPPPATVKKFYNDRKAATDGKVNKAVLIEDIIQAVTSHENEALKEVQKVAQGMKSSEGKALCELARTVAKECNKKCVGAVQRLREENKEGGVNAKKELEDLERHLRKLKNEEKGWIKAEDEIRQREKEIAYGDDEEDDGSLFSKKKTTNNEAKEAEEEAKNLISSIPDVDGIVQSVSEDITLQADRIGKVLRKCKVLIGESEDKRREVYNMFAGEGGLQFSGYEKVDDAKSLIRGLV